MTDKQLENELLKLAEQVANGECNTIKSNDFEDTNIVDALDIIRKVKNSFSQSEEVFESHGNVNKGDKWGHLKIIDEIGAGGIGLVYSAYDSVLDRDVAVKFLNPTSSQYISSKNFIDEARRLAKVRHPNVLAVFGANTYQNITGFWCDLLTGKTLSDVINEDLNWDKILQIAIEISSAIQEVHVNDVIHGDIKPSNIMFNKENQAVLMDFGSGSDLQNKSSQITSSTPIIMAPELFDGQSKTKASDIYSLGVVFYFLSSNGQYPYKANTLDQLKTILSLKQPINYSQIKGNKKWIGLIKSMLCFDPKESPTIEEVILELNLIKSATKRRKKKITLFTIAALLLMTITILIYSHFNLVKEQLKTENALNETSELNKVMFNMLASASPGIKGKDVLMVDVLDDLIEETQNSKNISNTTKAKTLFTLAHTLKNLKYKQKGSDLLETISNYSNVKDIVMVQILNAQSEFEINSQSKNALKKAQFYSDKATDLFESKKINDGEIKAKLDYTQALIAYKNKNNDIAIKHLNDALMFLKQQKPSKTYNRRKGMMYTLLGEIYSASDDFIKAIEYNKMALSNFQSFDQKITSNILIAKNNIAENLSKSGDTLQSEKIFQDLVTKSEDFLGSSHPYSMIFKSNFADVLNKNNKALETINIVNDILADIVEYYGKESLIYVSTQFVHANALKKLEQLEKAEGIFLETIKISSSQFGKNNPQLLNAQGQLAELYNMSDRPNKAIISLSELLPIAITELGEKDHITIGMKETMAWAQYLIDNKNKAKQLMQQVVKLKKEVYGENHEATLKSIKRLTTINSK